MARKHGRKGQILMDVDGASPYTVAAIADLNAWTLDLTRERVPVPAFGDTNIVRVAGLPDFSGTIGGWWNPDSSPTYFAAVLAGEPVMLRLMPDREDEGHYFEGLANLDGSINVSATGAAAISGNWDAADNWSMMPSL